MSRRVKRYFGFIPVPALLLVLALLYFIVRPSLFFEPVWLLPVTNTLFVTVVCFIIAYIAMRNYRMSGRVQVLLLGCGVFAFGLAAVLAAFLRNVPETGPNLNVTVYNTGALVAAILHFIAALILLSGISMEAGSKRKGLWAVGSYAGLAVFIALFTVLSVRGIIPPFFIQGVGATALRQEVLGTADILFAFSFLIFMGAYLKNRETFLYWYALALALTSISLTGFFIQSAVGSPIGWASRFSQYLGGIYFLIAILAAVRGSQARHLSFDRVLTAALSPAEEKFRALSENSPDGISRFDRELRYIYLNQAGTELYGKPAGSIAGRTVMESGLPEDYCSTLKEKIESVLETGRSTQMEAYLPTGESTRFYQSRCVPEYGPDGRVANVLVVSRDLTEHKRAEDALRESKQRWAITLSSIGDAVMATDTDGRITFMNSVAEALTGWTLHDAVMKPVKEVFTIIDEESRHEVDCPVAKVLREGMIVALANHTILVRKDGTEIPIDDSGAPIRGGDGNTMGVVLVFRDITERKQAEEARRESEERYRSLFDNMLNGFAYCKMLYDQDRPADFMYLDVNRAFQNLTGLKNVAGKKVSEVIPGLRESDPELFEIYGRVALTGTPEQFETYVEALGMWFSISVYSPRREYFVAVFDVITERKRSEEALRKARDELDQRVRERTAELEQKTHLLDTELRDMEVIRTLGARYIEGSDFDSLFGAVVDGAIAITKADKGNMQLFNPLMGRLNIVAHRGFGTPFLQFFESVEEGERTYGTAMKRAARIIVEDVTKSDIFQGKPALDVLLKDGIRAVQSTPLVSRSGQFMGMLSTHFTQVHTPDERELRLVDILARQAADIIERKQAEEKKAHLEEKLRQAQKMEAIGTLAGGIAHDFNNILAAIVGFTELVIDDVSDKPDVQHKMERVLTAGLRGRDLVKQILAFSRKTEGERKEISLVPLITETHALLRSSLPSTIQMPLVINTNHDHVLVDPTQLQQVLMNLATNAAYSMREDGGQLTIELSSATFPPGSILPDPDMKPGAYARLTVKDTGTGVSEEVRQRIFEPFFTTKQQGQGTGMGLAVVHGIVKAHQGAVTVRSAVGQGSTFEVFLPQAERPEAKKEETSTSVLPTGTERILFVDDEEMLVEMARGMLESLGYQVTIAANGTDAWNLFLEGPSRFDLIITDQTMPDMMGLTLARKMLRVRTDIPIVLCTGYSETVSAEKAKGAGICEFVMKPVMKKELAETIRRVLDGSKK